MKPKHQLYIILALALAIRLIFAVSWHEIWWDSGVYIGMGKYIFSGGENGLFEHIRPPLMPLILGFLWKIGLSPVLFGRLVEILFMLGIVWLTYQLANHWFEHKTALLAALIVALSPIFYYLTFHQYNEIPSTFFVLLALWLAIKEKPLWAGMTAGLAFLTKFAPGMIIGIIIIALIINKKWKQATCAAAGFAISTSPYFIWSWITYGSPLAAFHAAQEAIKNVLGCNIIRYKPWHQYFWWMVFSETKLHFMAIPGIIALWQKWNKKYVLFALSLAIPLIYFSQLNCRDYRYITMFLPFAAMLTALGTTWAYNKLRIKKEYVFAILLAILGIWMLSTATRYYYGNELQQPNPIAEEYFSYTADKEIAGEIWTANPIVAAYTDKKLGKIYYPVYDKGISNDFNNYLEQNKPKIGAILLDNCGGGIICPPNEKECEEQTKQLITQLDRMFIRAFDKATGNCWYTIWLTSAT
jgi:4-amino-4-deoxy-L-arabinose transferase-like glycosyltransferase